MLKPDFNLTANNADAVATLCRMLEGVPLAIEMAAAWARTLPPQGLLERLHQQLNLLVSRQRDLPLRHRSLQDARAQALMEEALTIFQSLGAKHGIAHTLRQLGNLALRQGDLARAIQCHREALAIWLELGEKQAIAYNLENMASWTQAAGNGQRTARLWGATARLRKSINTPLPPGEQRLFDLEVAQASADLGADLFTAAWEEGRALDWKQAAEQALNAEVVSKIAF